MGEAWRQCENSNKTSCYHTENGDFQETIHRYGHIFCFLSGGILMVTEPLENGRIKLFCKVDNCCDTEKSKGWFGGPKQRLLSLNGIPTDHEKYEATTEKDGFGLIIKHTSSIDFNVTYSCSYGFTQKWMILEEPTIYTTPGIQENENNKEGNGNLIVPLAIAFPILIFVLVINVIIIRLLVKYRTEKNKSRSSDNAEEIVLEGLTANA